MKKTFLAALLLSLGSLANAAIFTELPPPREPTKPVVYDTLPIEGGNVIDVDISNIFSHNILGEIPPNETRTVDVATIMGSAGQPFRVTGLGWNVRIDAFSPSWLSDAAIALGDDPSYANPELILVPGLGVNYGGLQQFESGGIVDLTNFPGSTDVSFELSEGILYLEFFERYDFYGGIAADALWTLGSSMMIQAVPVPEPASLGGWVLAIAACALRYRRT